MWESFSSNTGGEADIRLGTLRPSRVYVCPCVRIHVYVNYFNCFAILSRSASGRAAVVMCRRGITSSEQLPAMDCWSNCSADGNDCFSPWDSFGVNVSTCKSSTVFNSMLQTDLRDLRAMVEDRFDCG